LFDLPFIFGFKFFLAGISSFRLYLFLPKFRDQKDAGSIWAAIPTS